MTSHTPTGEGIQVSCYVHGVVEPAEGAWLVCFECGHVYPTAGALRREYRREYWRVACDDRFGRIPLPRRVWRVLTVRASTVYFCQHCVHDFAWMPPKRRWFRRGGDAA